MALTDTAKDKEKDIAIEKAYSESMTVVKAICADMDEIFLLDRNTKKVTVVRHKESVPGIGELLHQDFSYPEIVQAYIENNVVEKDRDNLREFLEMTNVCKSLENNETTSMFYRVSRDNEIHFFRLKCIRIGDPKDFSNIVLVFMPEDFETSQMQMIKALEIDDTTGLFTRQAFYNHVEALLDRYPNASYDLVVTDVENFKLINGIYGRGFGDKVLKYLAEQYSEVSKDGICGRIGADQFALFVPSVNGEKVGPYYDMADRIRNNAPVPYLTIRYGINYNVDRADSAGDMCDKALLAMRSKKNFHDDPISYYNSDVIQKNLRAQTFESEFERALAENRFVVWCQPKYNAHTKAMTSAEALVRWRIAEDNYISPAEFIPVFEADGLIVKLDEYIFRFVCDKQKKLLDQGLDPMPISVNMSRATLFSPGEVERYQEMIEKVNIPKRLVPIELTESATIETEQVDRLVDKLKTAGFVLHMDDFGAGYSSLSNLNSLHYDAIKLDKTLIDGIGTPRGEEIIRHLIGMTHFFQMEVIAEGVEQRAQYTFLKKLDCDTIQGYYFSRPVPFDEFLTLCDKSHTIKHELRKSPSSIDSDESNSSDEYEILEDPNEKQGLLSKLNLIKLSEDSHKKLYKGERNDNYSANAFSLKCMWISLMILFVCWVLDLLGVFIVDLKIMNTCMICSAILCGLTFLYARHVGIDRDASKYVILFALVAMYSLVFAELSYHTTLVMTFPLLCSMMYFDRKVTAYTYIIACVGYAAAIMIGYKIGLCDANMLLLTYTTSDFHSQLLASGDFVINKDTFLMFLYFVFPRWLLLLAIMPMLSHVAYDIQKKTKREAKIRHLAEIDGLTGVFNRYKFVQSINNYYPKCDQVSILYFDINNLKEINDNMGHEYGDKLICGLSEELSKRESDNCKSYRIGGDEFVMILEKNDARRVKDIQWDISKVLEAKIIEGDIKLSVAVGSASGSGKNIENIINEADENMYQHKLEMKKSDNS